MVEEGQGKGKGKRGERVKKKGGGKTDQTVKNEGEVWEEKEGGEREKKRRWRRRGRAGGGRLGKEEREEEKEERKKRHWSVVTSESVFYERENKVLSARSKTYPVGDLRPCLVTCYLSLLSLFSSFLPPFLPPLFLSFPRFPLPLFTIPCCDGETARNSRLETTIKYVNGL